MVMLGSVTQTADGLLSHNVDKPFQRALRADQQVLPGDILMAQSNIEFVHLLTAPENHCRCVGLLSHGCLYCQHEPPRGTTMRQDLMSSL